MKIQITSRQKTIKKLLLWANQQPYFCYFYPQQTEEYPYGAFAHQLVIGYEKLSLSTQNCFSSLNNFLSTHPNQSLYGYFSYDLKNQVEDLKSDNTEAIEWELCGFFKSDCIINFYDTYIELETKKEAYYKNLIEHLFKQDIESQKEILTPINITASTSKEEYLRTVLALKDHILEGNIYEINYCINFSISTQNFNPIEKFLKLCNHSPTPFANLLKWKNQYVLCASPERFIKMQNDKIISQPIKGTARRNNDKTLDELAKVHLATSEKEIAENMMIVDLVRNDLAKSSKAGTVKVEELFGIYSFKQVHQMISTITSHKKESLSGVDVIKNAFPMGSMTGAPKISAMQLIEQYETHKRGVFSGSIGFFKGINEFDFNVVIRSLFYDQSTGTINYQVGSAITHDCNPEEEYEECLLKAQAIEHILRQ